MFTGLIEEIGEIKKVTRTGNGIKFSVSAKRILENIQIGDSVNVNGVCQTVVKINQSSFDIDTVEETVKKTNLAYLKTGDKVNLETSLTLSKKLGGHFVLGHVDTTGKILSVKKLELSNKLQISYPSAYSDFLIHVGSIAVDGVSLTIADYNNNSFTVSVIPHTWQNTNLSLKSVGDNVNLEFDVLGKYVAKIIKGKSRITEEWLNNLGYK